MHIVMGEKAIEKLLKKFIKGIVYCYVMKILFSVSQNRVHVIAKTITDSMKL